MPHPVTLKRRKKRQELIQALGGKCARCGSSENLEFDHLDPNQKEFRVSEMLDWGEVRLSQEVEKCQLLCKDCHHQKTLENWEYGQEAPHGGIWRWRKYKCRCADCMQANDKYNEFRRAIYKMKKIKASFVATLTKIGRLPR